MPPVGAVSAAGRKARAHTQKKTLYPGADLEDDTELHGSSTAGGSGDADFADAGKGSPRQRGSVSGGASTTTRPFRPCMAGVERPRGLLYFKPEAKWSYDHQVSQIAIAALIVLNFGFNIVEKQIDPSGTVYPEMFLASEDFFNSIFAFELAWNLYANFFRDFICSSWNVFDTVVVSVGVLSLARIQLPSALSLLRCLRALRVFRLFKRVKSLLKILKSITAAVPGVLNAFVVVVIVISIYSILAVEFFYDFDQHPVTVDGVTEIECYYYNYNRPVQEDGELERVPSLTARGLCFSEEYYGTFFRAWYSLFQILTGDSWSEVLARPVVYGWDGFLSTTSDPDRPGEVLRDNFLSNFISTLFFMTFVMINSFVLINVVVAVLLDKMVSGPDEEEEESEDDDILPPDVLPSSNIKQQLEEQRDLGRKVDAMTAALHAMSTALERGRQSS